MKNAIRIGLALLTAAAAQDTLSDQVALWREMADARAEMTRQQAAMNAASKAFADAEAKYTAAKSTLDGDTAKAQAICAAQNLTFQSGSIVCK